MLFADLRGFTSFAESLLPYDVVHVLNRFYALAGGVMERHGGTIATYMGDGFMALFGVAPGDGPALRAVRAGLDLIEAVAGWRSYLELLHGKGLQVSVGVHAGRAVVGVARGRPLAHRHRGGRRGQHRGPHRAGQPRASAPGSW